MICVKMKMEKMPDSCGRCEGLKAGVCGRSKCVFSGEHLAYWGYETRDRNCPLVEVADGQ